MLGKPWIVGLIDTTVEHDSVFEGRANALNGGVAFDAVLKEVATILCRDEQYLQSYNKGNDLIDSPCAFHQLGERRPSIALVIEAGSFQLNTTTSANSASEKSDLSSEWTSGEGTQKIEVEKLQMTHIKFIFN